MGWNADYSRERCEKGETNDVCIEHKLKLFFKEVRFTNYDIDVYFYYLLYCNSNVIDGPIKLISPKSLLYDTSAVYTGLVNDLLVFWIVNFD